MFYYINENLQKVGNQLTLCEITLELEENIQNILFEHRGEKFNFNQLDITREDINILEQYGFLSVFKNNYNLIPNLGSSFFGLDSRCFLEDFPVLMDVVGLFEIPYYFGMYKHDFSVNSMSEMKESSYKIPNPNISNWYPFSLKKNKNREIVDYGFLRMSPKNTMEDEIYSIANKVFSKRDGVIKPVFIGGDHAITYPIIKGYKDISPEKKLRIIYLDAHSDLSSDKKELSHANVFSKILDFNNIELINFGIRGPITEEEEKKLENIKTFNDISMLTRYLLEDKHTDTYLSVDLDVFDPSFIQSVTFPVPDGISMTEFNKLINSFLQNQINIIGADIVEYNASFDNKRIGATNSSSVIYQVLKMLSYI